MHDPWSEARCPEIFGGWQLEKIFCSLVFLLWIWALKCPELSLWGGGCGCEVTRDSVITCCEDEVCHQEHVQIIAATFVTWHQERRRAQWCWCVQTISTYIRHKSTVLSQPKPPSQPHIPTARQSLWLYDETLNFNKYHLKSLILLNVRNLTASIAPVQLQYSVPWIELYCLLTATGGVSPARAGISIRLWWRMWTWGVICIYVDYWL